MSFPTREMLGPPAAHLPPHALAPSETIDQLLDENRLTSYFQPIVLVDRPEIVVAYECLARGLTRDGKLISPANIFRAAEQQGRQSILELACRRAAITLAARHAFDGLLFLNYDTSFAADSDCGETDLVTATLEILQQSGFPANRVVLEIVETRQIENATALRRELDRFREQGCRVALDDLGSGYNSLQRLVDLRPDFLKIDMELVRNVDLDPYKGAVTRKLLELAIDLNVQSIVEGIETAEEWHWSIARGADLAQGFFFGKPQPTPISTTGNAWERSVRVDQPQLHEARLSRRGLRPAPR